MNAPAKLTAAARIREALIPDSLGRNKAGNWVARWTFFYRHGRSSERHAADVRKALGDAIVVVDHGEVFKPFRGGATVAQGSHHFVEFREAEVQGLAAQEALVDQLDAEALAQAEASRAGMTLTLGHGPNPDIDAGYWSAPKDPAGPTTQPVASLEAAQIAACEFRDRNGLGGGNWLEAEVRDAAGALVARVSYNGRLWSPEGAPMGTDGKVTGPVPSWASKGGVA